MLLAFFNAYGPAMLGIAYVWLLLWFWLWGLREKSLVKQFVKTAFMTVMFYLPFLLLWLYSVLVYRV